MKILYAVKKNDPDYMEEIITTNEEVIDKARTWAIENGFDRFRVATFTDGERPDFISTINL
jgi:hypothetical protein